MYELSEAFTSGLVAIVVPEEYFSDFLEACITAEIPDSDKPSQRSWCEARYKEGLSIFANVQYGEYLNFWQYTEVGLEDYDATFSTDVITWEKALDLRHIRHFSHKDFSDIMELL